MVEDVKLKFSFAKAERENIEEIYELYQNVIKNTFTTWDKNYPSKSLLVDDVKNKNLVSFSCVCSEHFCNKDV